jgi:hypothetical protein
MGWFNSQLQVLWNLWLLCEKKKVGGLGLVDPMEATKVFLSKWVLHAFELWDSNIQEFVRFKPRGFQLHKGGKWALDFEWCV